MTRVINGRSISTAAARLALLNPPREGICAPAVIKQWRPSIWAMASFLKMMSL
jgi:hypothetical protein